MNAQRLQILRTIDKIDRLEPIEIYRKFRDECEISELQALLIMGFVYQVRNPELSKRIESGLRSAYPEIFA